jgi:hypothetical protein
MTLSTIYTPSNRIIRTVFFAFIIFSLASCAKKIHFQTSSVVPAANGTVKVKRDDNKNYLIQIKLQDLAEVSRLQQGKQGYVVWLVTDNDETKNIGRITSDKNFLSRKLKANFETVTAVKPKKVFVTAEVDTNAQYPDSQIILTTDNF